MTTPDLSRLRYALRRELVRTNPALATEVVSGHVRRPEAPYASQDRVFRWFREAAVGRYGAAPPPAAVRRLIAGGHLPAAAAGLGAPTRPGVVGLAYHPDFRFGLVYPLRAEVAQDSPPGWTAAPHLPFDGDEVRELAVWAAAAGGWQTSPEAARVRIDSNPLPPAAGESMTLAGFLAVARAAADPSAVTPSHLLAAVAAVARVDTGGRVRRVRKARAKLRAFAREYGTGTLLVAPAGDPAVDEFRPCFEAVWEVETLDDLVERLAAAGVCPRFTDATPLTPAQAVAVVHQFAQLPPRDARRRLAVARRHHAHRLAPAVPLRLRLAIQSNLGEALRGCGLWREARRAAAARYRCLRSLTAASDDARLAAATDHAAGLLQAFHPRKADAVLSRWQSRLIGDPGRFSPETRVMAYNTLARARVLLPGREWAGLFSRSLRIQAELDPGGAGRTRAYLIHGLLRHDQHDEAAQLIAEADADPEADPMTRDYVEAYRADLIRRRRRTADPGLGAGVAYAYRLVAAGRQPWPTAEQRAGYLERAADEFERAVPAVPGGGGLVPLLAAVLRVRAAAARGDRAGWPAAVRHARATEQAERENGLGDWLSPTLAGLPDDPAGLSADQLETLAEAVVARVPFF